ERALVLDPNSAWAWNRSGWLQSYLDKPDVAIEHFERSLRLSPLDPMNFNAFIGIGSAHFAAGRYFDSILLFWKGGLRHPRRDLGLSQPRSRIFVNWQRCRRARGSFPTAKRLSRFDSIEGRFSFGLFATDAGPHRRGAAESWTAGLRHISKTYPIGVRERF